MPLPTIPSGNVFSSLPTGYDVDNSCRFNSGDSAYLSRTMEAATNRKKCTISVWLKKCSLSGNQVFFGGGDGDAANGFIDFNSSNDFFMQASTNTVDMQFVSDAKYRDTASWYHVLVAIDTTQATDTNRVKIYINGTQVTSFSTATYPDQDYDLQWAVTGDTMLVGKYPYTSSYWDGYMAEFHYVDGTAYSPSDFGEFDEDSPTIWKPIEVSGLTYGNQGFYLDFADSGDLGDDESGNTNDFTENNLAATDQSTDTPTNSFCTMNPLDNYHAGSTLSEGNLKVVGASGGWNGTNTATMGVSAGKWYWELFADTDANVEVYGIKSGVSHTDSNYVTETTATGELGYAYVTTSGNMGYPSGNSESYGSAIDADDVIMFALDMDNLKFYIGINGTWQNSGDPAGNSNGYSITAPPSGFYFPAVSFYVVETIYLNFGSPPTGFTISSGNADGDGYGNFEYSVPSGFYSLCTKNLAEYG